MTDKTSLVQHSIIDLGDKISALVSAAGITVQPYWPKLFAKAVEGKNIADFFNFGASSAPSGPAPVAVTTQAPK